MSPLDSRPNVRYSIAHTVNYMTSGGTISIPLHPWTSGILVTDKSVEIRFARTTNILFQYRKLLVATPKSACFS